MTAMRSISAGLALACGSLAATSGLWVWILTRPHGTFHDQGGMMISFVLLPAALLGWVLLAVPSIVLCVKSIRRGTAQERTIASMIIFLDLFALWYSFATAIIP